jgi:preprotein translocase subunit YajC
MITSSLIIGAAPLSATSSHSSSSSSSSLSFLVIILLIVAVYFFFLRPRQQRAKAQAAKGKTLGMGDEVMSVGGIYGRVVGLSDDESVDVEVAPGIVLTFLRRAVNQRPASPLSRTASAGSSAVDRDDMDRNDMDHDDLAHPYGGSMPDPTAFGASSGHFGDSRDEDEEGEEEDYEDDEDYEDEDLEGSDDGDVAEAGEASENGHRYDDDGSSGGPASGTPRTTGGSRSEED